ncbi:MAG: hypothetical protein WCG21_10875 [Eubacteriales bacterium]
MSVNQKIYEVVLLLGKGKGGYSYLVTADGKQYVLKQIHHEACDYYQFGNKMEAEINDYRRISETGIRVPAMLDADDLQERILKEFVDGDTIYDLVLKDKMQKSYFDQIDEMCKKLYPANLNIDYFPTNFVVQDGLIYYVDYECNQYSDQWNFKNWGIRFWSKTKEFIDYAESQNI